MTVLGNPIFIEHNKHEQDKKMHSLSLITTGISGYNCLDILMTVP